MRRGSPWIRKLSRSPPQKLVWITSGRAAKSADSSAEYSPANSRGNCSARTRTSGFNLRMDSRKVFQESCPQA
jgi:hypothetical protein